MKSYNTVFNKNKKLVLEQRQYTLDAQKKQVLEALKLDNFYSGKITDLPKSKQEKYLKQLLEYWNPKTGLTKAGEKYLQTGVTVLNESSDSYDIRKYILKQVTLHEAEFINAFKNNNGKYIIEALQSNIESQVNKKISSTAVFNIVYSAIEDKFKNEIMK